MLFEMLTDLLSCAVVLGTALFSNPPDPAPIPEPPKPEETPKDAETKRRAAVLRRRQFSTVLSSQQPEEEQSAEAKGAVTQKKLLGA